MNFIRTEIPNVVIIEPNVHGVVSLLKKSIKEILNKKVLYSPNKIDYVGVNYIIRHSYIFLV